MHAAHFRKPLIESAAKNPFNEECLGEVKAQIHSGEVSNQIFQSYISLTFQQLNQEITNPCTADPLSKRKWENLTKVLFAEALYKEKLFPPPKGCSPIHFISAMQEFLKPILASPKDLLTKALKRYDSLLNCCFKIASFTNALKLLPPKQTKNYPNLIESFLHQWSLQELKKNKEILFPLGWQLPSNPGHFLLAKLSDNGSEKTRRTKIQVFDSQPSLDELQTPLPIKTGVTKENIPIIFKASSFTIISENCPEKALKNLYSLIPLHIPKFWEEKKSQFSGESIEKDMEQTALKATYFFFDAKEKSDLKDTPLSYFPTGGNCVTSSFRMLLYTLAREEAENGGLCLKDYERLKVRCDSLFTQFSFWTSSRFYP